MPQPSRALALIGVLLLYLGGWGPGLVDAIVHLVDPSVPASLPWDRNLNRIVATLATATVVVFAAVLFAGRYRLDAAQLGLAWPRNRQEWIREAWMFAVFLALTALALVVVPLLLEVLGVPATSYPHPTTPTGWDWARTMSSSLMAGPTEEIVLLAVTVAVLRRVQFGWPVVAGVAVLLRVSFHVYYGLHTLPLILWAAGLVAAYRYCGRVLSAVVAHSLWDITSDVSSLSGSDLPQILLFLCGVPGLVFILSGRLQHRTWRFAPDDLPKR